MKKFTALALALVLTLTLAACGGNRPAPSEDNGRPAKSTPTPGGSSDPSGNGSGEENLGSNDQQNGKSGTLYGWGRNTYGQLGNGTTTDSAFPSEIMDDVTAVSGDTRVLALKTDGSLWAWGHNSFGQLGDGTTEERATPVKIMDGVKAADSSSYTSAAIKNDGSLWIWGSISTENLGVDNIAISAPEKVMDGVKAVSAGEDVNMAIKEDGSLWGWGREYGLLGSSEIETDITTPVKIMDGVKAVSVYRHVMVIKDDDTLYTWGNNEYGKLGDGTTDRTIPSRMTPEKIMDGVKAVSTGVNHSMAIKTDGSLWTWGSNSRGQLGDGTTEHSAVPMKIMDNVTAVCAAQINSYAIAAPGGGAVPEEVVVLYFEGTSSCTSEYYTDDAALRKRLQDFYDDLASHRDLDTKFDEASLQVFEMYTVEVLFRWFKSQLLIGDSRPVELLVVSDGRNANIVMGGTAGPQNKFAPVKYTCEEVLEGNLDPDRLVDFIISMGFDFSVLLNPLFMMEDKVGAPGGPLAWKWTDNTNYDVTVALEFITAGSEITGATGTITLTDETTIHVVEKFELNLVRKTDIKTEADADAFQAWVTDWSEGWMTYFQSYAQTLTR